MRAKLSNTRRRVQPRQELRASLRLAHIGAVEQTAAAIEYYHKVSEFYFDTDFITVVLKNAAEYAALRKNSDEPKPNGHDAHPEGNKDDGSKS